MFFVLFAPQIGVVAINIAVMLRLLSLYISVFFLAEIIVAYQICIEKLLRKKLLRIALEMSLH